MLTEYPGWLLVVIASLFLAYVLTKLVTAWLGKTVNFGSPAYNQDQKYNNRLFWSSYTIFFLVSVFLLPCYLKDILCLK